MSESHEFLNEFYVLYNRIMNPLTAHQERKTRKDRGMRRGRHSTSSSSAFDLPSSFHLNDDDDNDENDEGTSRASTPSPTGFVNSLTNEVPRVFQNPPNIDHDMEPFYTCQTEIINCQVQLRDEQHGGLRSIEKGLENFDEDVTTTPSPITTSSSPSPPKPSSTKDTSSTFVTTSSSFESKPQSSPPTSNDTPSPQPSNPF
ncbi:hypothetical protein Tco_1067459 [Tanacetum coccineum]|uniref:Uncharacterized protein n=1 Tax=Tanacetum coccineum TaxID=301880 RepID=A0ABQ5HD04_9ASTR